MPTRDTGSSREGLCVHVSPQSLREPAASPSSLPPPPAATQVKTGGDEGTIPPRTKEPPEEQTLSLSISVDVPSTPPGDMLASRAGRPKSVSGKEEPDRIEEEEVEAGPFDTYFNPEDSAEDEEGEEEDGAEQDFPEDEGG